MAGVQGVDRTVFLAPVGRTSFATQAKAQIRIFVRPRHTEPSRLDIPFPRMVPPPARVGESNRMVGDLDRQSAIRDRVGGSPGGDGGYETSPSPAPAVQKLSTHRG